MPTTDSSDDHSPFDLLNDLRYGDSELQERALTRLTAIGEADALDAIIDYLREQPPVRSEVGFDALRVLANKYVPSDRYGLAEVLIPYLSAEDWSQRLGATRLLGTHPNELAAYALRDLVDDARDTLEHERRSRFSSVRAIAERTLSEGIMALASCGRLMVHHDILDLMDDPPLRPLATRALGVIGSETDRPELEDLAEDESAHVRDAAQWSLSLMDERAEQFTHPPDYMPEPPPDRLSPMYWAHRLLSASDDALTQFLIVRLAVEHLILDAFLSDGRVPDECLIVLREYEGNMPPDFRANAAPMVGLWKYFSHGPDLEQQDMSKAPPPPPPTPRHMGLPMQCQSHMTISVPARLCYEDEGLVSFDCVFEPFLGRGWIYQVTRKDDGWSFALVQRTWSS